MQLRIVILFIFILSKAIGQNDPSKIREVFLKSQKFYDDKPNYQIDVDYLVYKSETSKELLQKYKSILIKNKKDYYTKIKNTEFIDIANKSIKINHDERAVLLTKRSTRKNSMEFVNTILSLLPQFKSFEITQTKESIICEFVSPKITQLPFYKAVISFNKDYSMKSQVLYLSQALPYLENKKNIYRSPRLEINLSNFRPYEADDKLKLASYIKPSKLGSQLSNKYLKYQLIIN